MSPVIEEVPFCNCTNEELEEGRTCGLTECPNYDASVRQAVVAGRKAEGGSE